MSKISKRADSVRSTEKMNNDLQVNKTVVNFMGGDSYVINPLDTLKMISASSIFGEPSYYRDNEEGSYITHRVKEIMAEYCGKDLEDMGIFENSGKTTEQVFEEAVDAALDYDFEGTIKWAETLRKDYYMRLNPQVIIARAAMHPKRKEFSGDNSKNRGKFREAARNCMTRADDALNGMAYYIYSNKGKSKMPSVLKRAYADHLSSMSRYAINKYKNSGIGIIDGVRICHATSPAISELMKTGSVSVEESEKTWETLRSSGMGWADIFKSIKMGHMALLRNLRGFFTEVEDIDLCRKYLETLKSGVLSGKQFPFRYYSAYKAVLSATGLYHKQMVLDTLEECFDISCNNLPKLKGKTMVLSDNSGSAWGTINSEYGSVTIAEIDNISAVVTASRSDEGYVGKFGDRLIIFPISKRNGLLKQAMDMSANQYADVGGNTEGGIWEFFRDAIKNEEHWDNIFIYSDQQAGHCGLYGTYAHKGEYTKYGYNRHAMINVFKIVLDYRRKVYKDVNMFSVQTAGYDNNVLPEYAYRTNLMYGWTGKETVFADTMIKQWDEIQHR